MDKQSRKTSSLSWYFGREPNILKFVLKTGGIMSENGQEDQILPSSLLIIVLPLPIQQYTSGIQS